ncbi:sensor histidine kinase [Ornithinibacillus bavariensis]|uniref:histidine kinase n=1 Tax=Ornithinibacillus bavariensis TaxID=545502 RepID=A0A920C6M3_9BACI|nr:sensor histidine kinase [Ornithinibacillus bavariensis]GIO27955.1 sensor protein BceS [Ornithinibacillus bavariensis]HAM81095.1 sensor histidine kinase [Ornithinibacillus sp.]
MFIRYIVLRKSWIFLFVALLGVTNILIMLDKGITVEASSILYLNALFLITFCLFFLWRYKKEMKFTTSLDLLSKDLPLDWIENLPEPENRLDEITYEFLRAVDLQYKRQVSKFNEARLIEDDYMASWIHEVKTPLTAMKLVLDARRSDSAIRQIEVEWLKIHLLLDRQLYMTRLPTLESDYRLEEASLQRLATEEVQDLASWCLEKNLAVNIEGTNVTVVTDVKWCRFILRQLLTNAIKYSPVGGTIVIKTNVSERGNVTLDLQDEGPGIQPHDLPRIFDKGFTGENGRIQNAATGLGLYLAKTVADKLGITLKAKSSKSGGTVMQITFSDPNTFETIRRSNNL